MKLSLIATIVVLPIILLSCGIPEDSKPGSVVSPLIDRADIPAKSKMEKAGMNTSTFLMRTKDSHQFCV